MVKFIFSHIMTKTFAQSFIELNYFKISMHYYIIIINLYLYKYLNIKLYKSINKKHLCI